jgi:hypothetical protein
VHSLAVDMKTTGSIRQSRRRTKRRWLA